MDLGVNQVVNNGKVLFAGDFPRQMEPVVIASGAGVLVKGTVLGKITASSKYDVYDDGNADGTETAKRILAHDIDATAADVNVSVYRTGCFNEDALTGIDANGIADLDAELIFVRTIG